MEDLEKYGNTNSNKRFEFRAEGGEYFGIWIVNTLLTVLTLGIYYFWAKTKERQFFHSNTYLADSPFAYHGTAKELFLGFIKAFAVFLIPYLILTAAIASQNQTLIVITVILFYLFLLVIIPIAVHGSLRYQTSRTSWRGIYYGYNGNLNEFIKLFLKNILLTLITFGIYGSWSNVNIRKYIYEHLNFGNITAKFKGKGGDLFVINLVGILLTIITCGIYSFWWMKNVINFYISNTELQQDGRTINLNSTISAGGIFGLGIINFLLIVFTLGFAIPWVVIRTIRFYIQNVTLDNNFEPNAIVQGTIDSSATATGDDMLDFLS